MQHMVKGTPIRKKDICIEDHILKLYETIFLIPRLAKHESCEGGYKELFLSCLFTLFCIFIFLKIELKLTDRPIYQYNRWFVAEQNKASFCWILCILLIVELSEVF